MNVQEYQNLIKSTLEIHNAELLKFYKSYHEFPTSTHTINGSRQTLHSMFEIKQSDNIITKYFKSGPQQISFVTTEINKLIAIKNRIKYYEQSDIFLIQPYEKNSKITLADEKSVGIIVGGSPTFKYNSNARWYWNDLLHKDEHFNSSIDNKLLSYETYLVMNDIYPIVPNGTYITMKELFNE